MEGVRIILGKVEHTQRQMNRGLSLYLVLRGEIEVENGGDISLFSRDSCFCINNGDVWSMRGISANVILGLQFEEDFLNRNAPEMLKYTFQYEKGKEENNEELKKSIADTAFAYLQKEEGGNLLFLSYLFRTLYCLFQFCRKNPKLLPKNQTVSDERLIPVLEYIGDHYKSRIRLKELASQAFMSEQYLSKLFFSQMGVHLTKYLSALRLNSAIRDLLYTDKKITDIAMDNGFASTKAFDEQFKLQYGMLPREYRKKNALNETKEDRFFIQAQLKNSDSMETLGHYLNPGNQFFETSSTRQLVFNMEKRSEKNIGKCARILNVGEMERILRLDVQKQIREAVEKISFQYVYFYHFFSQSVDRNAKFHIFRMTDYIEIFHLFRLLHLIPFFRIELGELLEAPGGIEEACNEMTVLLSNIRHEYDDKGFHDWHFEIVGTEEELSLYYNMVCESIDRAMGGCEIGIHLDVSGKWKKTLEGFREFLRRGQISFFTMEVDLNLIPLPGGGEEFAEKCKYYIQRLSREIRSELEQYPHIRLYMINWNVLTGRTSLEAGEFHRTALIADQILQMSEILDGIGFAVNLQNPYSKNANSQLYSYGLSLFYYKTVKRHLFFVVRFMDSFRQRIVYMDGNVVCTSHTGNAVVYTFFFYNPWYMNPFESLSAIRNESYRRSFKIICRNMVPGHYRVKKTVFNRDSGGIYTRIANVENRQALNMEEYGEYLENSSYPDLMLTEQDISTEFILYQEVPLNGIAYIVFRKLD